MVTEEQRRAAREAAAARRAAGDRRARAEQRVAELRALERREEAERHAEAMRRADAEQIRRRLRQMQKAIGVRVEHIIFAVLVPIGYPVGCVFLA